MRGDLTTEPDVGRVGGASDLTESTRALGAAFARSLATAGVDEMRSLLADDVAVLVPGRGPAAGRHEGRRAAIEALFVPGRRDASVGAVEVAEVLADGRRALVVVAQVGRVADRNVAWETAFHLQTDGERILGVTEYSGDQHAADEVVTAPDPVRRERRWSPWRRSARRVGSVGP